MTQKLQREQNRFDMDRSQLNVRADEAYRRLRKVEKELEEAKEDRLSMLTQITNLDHEKRTLSEQKAKMIADHQAEISSSTQKHQDRVEELEARLQGVTETHSRTCREMQQLIAEQRKLGDKW